MWISCGLYSMSVPSSMQCLSPFVNVTSDSGPLKCSLDTDGDGLPDHVVRIVCVLYCTCVAYDCA